MPGWTNKGKWRNLLFVFNNTIPTNFYLALVTSAVAPGPDINTFGELTEIAAGNGYTTGGFQLTPNATDFDVAAEDDANNRGTIQIKDIVWTASGGSIPASGDGARYAVLLDDNVTIADREVLHFWDLTSNKAVSDGQNLTLEDCELRNKES